MSRERVLFLPCGHVPHPHRRVASGACQRRPILRECHRLDVVGMSREDVFLLSCGHVPQPHRMVPAAACQRQTVGRKRHRIDSERMSCDQVNFRPGAGIVEPDSGAGAHRQARSVRRPDHVAHVSFAEAHQGAFGQAPAIVVLCVAVLCKQDSRRKKNEARKR